MIQVDGPPLCHFQLNLAQLRDSITDTAVFDTTGETNNFTTVIFVFDQCQRLFEANSFSEFVAAGCFQPLIKGILVANFPTIKPRFVAKFINQPLNSKSYLIDTKTAHRPCNNIVGVNSC